jgi:protein-disulfide isomerase
MSAGRSVLPGHGALTAGGLAVACALALAYPGPRPRPLDSSDGDRPLHELFAILSADERQTLSDSLEAFRRAPETRPAPPPGVGRSGAPVRIAEFTDVRCPHCARLHYTLQLLRDRAPAGSFRIELRQFPLDGACNPAIAKAGVDPVRCLAAKAQICLAGHPRAEEYTAALFDDQDDLGAEEVYAYAAPYRSRADLQRCVESKETQARLEADVRDATRNDFEGTPLVLVNGRKGTTFAPFLYALILTGGRADHPALASLPPPRPEAHIH